MLFYIFGRPTNLCAMHCFDAVFNQPWAGRSAKELSHSKLLCGNLGFQVTQLLHAGASAHRKGIRNRLKTLKPAYTQRDWFNKNWEPKSNHPIIYSWLIKQGTFRSGFLAKSTVWGCTLLGGSWWWIRRRDWLVNHLPTHQLDGVATLSHALVQPCLERLVVMLRVRILLVGLISGISLLADLLHELVNRILQSLGLTKNADLAKSINKRPKYFFVSVLMCFGDKGTSKHVIICETGPNPALDPTVLHIWVKCKHKGMKPWVLQGNCDIRWMREICLQHM